MEIIAFSEVPRNVINDKIIVIKEYKNIKYIHTYINIYIYEVTKMEIKITA